MAVTQLDTRQFSTDAVIRGSRNRLLLATAAMALLSLALARLVLAVDMGAILIFGIVITVVAVIIQPRYGLYAIFAVALLFEVGSGDHLMDPGSYLGNSLQTSFNANGLILIPLEMLLLITSLAWLAQALMRRRLPFRSGSLGLPVLLLCLMLIFGMVRGLATGAIFNYAFWESRFLFWMALCYVVAANTIRTPGHVRTLQSLIIICVGLSGIEGLWRKFALIDTGQLGPAQEFWYAHESVAIWGLLIMLVFGQQAFGAPKWQRVFGPILFVITEIG